MKKYFNVFLIMLVACVFAACGGDDDTNDGGGNSVNINEGSDNKTDVAVTGAVYSMGLSHAEIYGYVNLDKLPTSTSMSEMGIEYWTDDEDYSTKESTENLETGNRLEIDLTELDANVTYTYRTYVRSSDGVSYYGKKETFTTKNYDFDNVVASCSESEVTPFTAKITYTFDTTKFVSDIRDAEATEVGILYSYNRNELSPDSSARSERDLDTYGKIKDITEYQIDKSTYTYIVGSPDSPMYYRFYTKIGGKYALGEIKQLTFKSMDNIPTSGAVDLGLGVKWAACNLGASSPYALGDKYAWGETTSKTSFSWYNYKWADGEFYMTKYNSQDDTFTLTADDDAATVNLGGSWRMPTYDEIRDFFSGCKFVHIYLDEYQQLGYFIIGPNGNYIFLPDGEYWTSTLQNTHGEAWAFLPEHGGDYVVSEALDYDKTTDRYNGLYIRPVCE